MILKIFEYENDIIFSNKVNIICFENKKEFCRIVENLYSFCLGIESNNKFSLVENDKQVKIANYCLMLIDIFGWNLNDKKIQNKLFQKLTYTFIENVEERQRFSEATNALVNCVLSNIHEFDIDLDYVDEIEYPDILKLLKVKVQENATTIFGKIFEIIDLVSELKLYKILILPNLRDFLSNDELQELYKYAIYKEVHLLILETSTSVVCNENEIVHSIDADFYECVIIS